MQVEMMGMSHQMPSLAQVSLIVFLSGLNIDVAFLVIFVTEFGVNLVLNSIVFEF